MKYLPIIGLEIHVQPKTNSKMFCSCSADIFQAEPNTHTCPVCLGLPGALPVPNKLAVEQTIKLGLAVGSKIATYSQFDRKNYFYPDLPKGYQISQYEHPLATAGAITVFDAQTKAEQTIHFTRIHLEEDTGRLQHKNGYTLVDFNRSGMPLIEIVTEPDIHTTIVMKKFLKKLRLILRYAGISDADMEKGTMRIEPNISVAEVEDTVNELTRDQLPNYKVELKNINSFRFAEKAVEFEIRRQIEALKKGETLVQETRGWNENTNETVSQRVKEEAHDYRYFPEPDIPPLSVDSSWVEEIEQQIPQLPDDYQKLFASIGLGEEAVETLLEKNELLQYAELLLEHDADLAKSLIIRIINQPELREKFPRPKQLIEYTQEEKAGKLDDTAKLENIIRELIQNYPDEIKRYQSGKVELLQFFVGKVMAETKGKAEPKATLEVLKKILS